MWVRIEDGFPDHPRIVGLSVEARWQYVVGLCYSARFLTDGRIPATVVADPGAAAELVKAGLWARRGETFVVHDWADYNPSRADVEARRKAERERKRRYRRDDGGRYAGP